MIRGNVLVIGNPSVEKSTLINAVLGEEEAERNNGTFGNVNAVIADSFVAAICKTD